MKIMKHFLMSLLLAGLLIGPAGVFGLEIDIHRDLGLGPEWYIVTRQVTGFRVEERPGGRIVLVPTSKGWQTGGMRIPVARVLRRVTEVGKPVTYDDGKQFDYPTDPAYIRMKLGTSNISTLNTPPAWPHSKGLDRQPKLTNGPERRGSLTEPGLVNLVERFRAEGRQLADWQVQELRKREGEWLPGTQYVTVIVQPDDNPHQTPDGRWALSWKAAGWVYTFEVDGELVLQQLKQPQCPPGSPGTWPKCDTPPPPPPPPPQS